ncbi:MAG: sialidase family protein [Pirellulales bacterium]
MQFYKYPTLGAFLFLSAICLVATTSFAQEKPTKDAAEPGASHWSFGPDYETVKSRVSYVPGIKVIRGDTQVIVPEHKRFCPAGSVFKYNNGDIHVYNRRSSDGGKTWHETEHILENPTYQYPEPDGEVIMFESLGTSENPSGAGRPEISMAPTDQKGVYEAKFFRSNDHGLSRKSDPARIHLPEPFHQWTGRLCRNIVALQDGSLLVSIYGRQEKGTGLAKKYRSLALRSTDRGKTWHYLSTIAFDALENRRGEGFDETSLVVLPDGKVLSFLRSGASYQASIGSSNNNDPSVKMPFSYGKQTPIYMTSSIDGGKNWSVADPISPYGVWPNAVLMENGILAVSYGRPGNWLMFSKDAGNRWGPIIPFYHDLYPPDCGNYFSMAEVAPNILLVVYARTNPNDHWKSELVGTYFRVLRDGE